MADEMVHHMLANQMPAGAAAPGVGSAYFGNWNPQRPNKNVPADQPTTRLRPAANGRTPFVDRKHADMMAKEHRLKREGITDIGRIGPRRRPLMARGSGLFGRGCQRRVGAAPSAPDGPRTIGKGPVPSGHGSADGIAFPRHMPGGGSPIMDTHVNV